MPAIPDPRATRTQRPTRQPPMAARRAQTPARRAEPAAVRARMLMAELAERPRRQRMPWARRPALRMQPPSGAMAVRALMFLSTPETEGWRARQPIRAVQRPRPQSAAPEALAESASREAVGALQSQALRRRMEDRQRRQQLAATGLAVSGARLPQALAQAAADRLTRRQSAEAAGAAAPTEVLRRRKLAQSMVGRQSPPRRAGAAGTIPHLDLVSAADKRAQRRLRRQRRAAPQARQQRRPAATRPSLFLSALRPKQAMVGRRPLRRLRRQ